jgi:predicted nuclease with TOPRIM domain
MVDQSLGKIMTATDPADVAQLAMIEALRSIADSGQKTAKVLEAVQTEVRDVRERLIRIEAAELKSELGQNKREIERLKTRVDTLEAYRDRQDGGKAFADALLKYGPFLIALVSALFVLLVATGRIVL